MLRGVRGRASRARSWSAWPRPPRIAPVATPRRSRSGGLTFGENRPQELRRKAQAIAEIDGMQDVRLDMIGNLQTNKINQVIGIAHLIHSVSSLHLAEAISKRALAKGLVAKVLLEVNVSGEESKSGFSPARCASRSTSCSRCPALDRGPHDHGPRPRRRRGARAPSVACASCATSCAYALACRSTRSRAA